MTGEKGPRKPLQVGQLVRKVYRRGNRAIVYRVDGEREERWTGATLYLLRPVLDPCGQPVTRHHGYRPLWVRRAEVVR